jgi:predicted ribosome quality control (RQC) complex YloA/Tae2 family protein
LIQAKISIFAMPFLYDPNDADFASEASSTSWSQESPAHRIGSSISRWIRELDDLLDNPPRFGGPVTASVPSPEDTLYEDWLETANQQAQRAAEQAQDRMETRRRQLEQVQRRIEQHQRGIERLESELEAQRQAQQARRAVSGSEGGP